jgi:ABC-type dipeptide/oligopeptide/nickel transport system ATPase component
LAIRHATTEAELEASYVQFARIPTGIELARGAAPVAGEVLAARQQLARDGMTMVVVTHEMSFARDIADRIVFMDGGVIVEEGKPDRLLFAPQTERARFPQTLRRPLPDMIPADSRYHPRPGPGRGFVNLPGAPRRR